ncbi:dUTP diphosphatase [Candidatus Roizmanbacteria bacterium CG09_land_8_20_14_0_10_41_9]|uniref:dUTP diphosphatase n=1 Tax=Candidatus Roizmanbacteria bacterium CG09_land_8_20_14_0_10_41_9 TaxID=1974850 RepID=A0A2H0WUN4_9BACT|nr:MAG: dUTP diphosphatase [Candidatus Roizmanbacteria bacterium CG09_land_8_20_14_0_10_41_9]
MKIQIKRIDKILPLPQYQTKGSVAFDLVARESKIILPFQPTIIPLNVIIKIPKGYFLLLACRSSLPIKKTLMVSNGIGIIDQDYHGDKDEIGLQVVNFSKEPVTVEKGERIAQAICVKIAKITSFIEKRALSKASRGGWGSTDKSS